MASCPFSTSRRALLRGLAAGTGAGTLALASAPVCAHAVRDHDATPSSASDGTLDRQPFHGPHQAGIVTPQPAAALVVALDVLAEDRGELAKLFRILTERFAFLSAGGPVPPLDPRLPPADSGILGPQVLPDNFTATLSVGASLFDDRYGLEGVKPKALRPMDRFPNDSLDAKLCHGDLLLQFCANTAETTLHALRDVIRHTPGLVSLRWKLEGMLPPHVVKRPGKDTVRNFLGFKDGTANLDAADDALMRRQVWVQPGREEPAWASGGSYQVVRIIRNFVERWDRTPLREQERIFGRHKDSGAPLGGTDEHALPDYASDPAGARTPMDAHIRLANPRTPETASSLILRRGYNYSAGITPSGQLDMGLLFVCFQSDLDAGFVAVQNRLNGEPLEEYIKPVGGGYFYALPGVPEPGGFLGQGLLVGA
ncbi:iron uptake transporter deferrochelatase/peroxidase subunit [Methylobacterium sp. 17Sr1-1]|uniref:iron uptake transporter deferrochelatase/peroxidase subunit n=1 Tax=Methylobacterium sp. 17Sr1-1 TaxID=2202826 RepID=UPI000D6F16FB|nr:iron uptake transporter deferrochelatase/peroxidase subunit [Methylobacterium sp. 17Sr1-1]AWN52136.1 deferrochelatase/peroxidase EfeB [Methylobacterium sp. 17Sr1-1]